MKTDLQQMKRDVILAENQKEIVRIHAVLLAQIGTVKQIAEESRQQLRRVMSLPAGKKGDKGDPGKDARGLPGKPGKDGIDGKDGLTPVKGKDYWTPKDVEQLTLGVLSRIRTPKDGENAVVDEAKIADSVIKLIKEQQLLNTDHIKGLRSEISSYRHQMAMRQAGQTGGGMTLTAGANITLTPQTDGTTLIAAAGGGGLTQMTPVESPNGVETEFTFSAPPILILTEFGMFFEDATYGFTLVGNVATLPIAPSNFVRGYT